MSGTRNIHEVRAALERARKIRYERPAPQPMFDASDLVKSTEETLARARERHEDVKRRLAYAGR